MATLSLMFEVY